MTEITKIRLIETIELLYFVNKRQKQWRNEDEAWVSVTRSIHGLGRNERMVIVIKLILLSCRVRLGSIILPTGDEGFYMQTTLVHCLNL